MQNKSFIVILTSVLLLSTLFLVINIEIVHAFEGNVTINEDGSITPETAPIQLIGNLYLVTDDINCSSGSAIIILKSNIVVDGQGHILTGTGDSGILVYHGSENVTVRNFEINNFRYGIHFTMMGKNCLIHNNIISSTLYGIFFEYACNNNEISNNVLRENTRGVSFNDYAGSSSNLIHKNNVTNNNEGIYLPWSSYNTVSDNIIKNNKLGIFLSGQKNILSKNKVIKNQIGILLEHDQVSHYLQTFAHDNTITENLIASNTEVGLSIINSTEAWFWHGGPNNGLSLPNYVYHNSFFNNTIHAKLQHPDFTWGRNETTNDWYAVPIIDNSTTVMDDGYPSGGNYWDDYTGIDADGDGIGDTPYIIDKDNADRYPLVKGSPDLVVPEVPFGSLATLLGMFCAISVFVLIKKRTR